MKQNRSIIYFQILPHMTDQDLQGYQARTYKRIKQTAQGFEKKEFLQDIQFLSNPSKSARKFEEKQKISNIQDQINYFGYQIEPFHMKQERDIGNFDKQGHFLFDKKKDQDINDAWLDSLEKDNEFDKYKQSYDESVLDRIRQLDQKNDGYQKQRTNYSNQEIGSGFFKSKKFKSREEAQEFYVASKQSNLDQEIQQDQIQEEQVRPNKDEEFTTPPENQEEFDEEQEKIRKGYAKKQKRPSNAIQNLWNLEVKDLKQILFDLLDDEKNSNQTIKRLQGQINACKSKHSFKKNVRKNKIQEEKLVSTELSEDQKLENKLTCDLIVDLCHIIMSKTEDPSIYGVKKEDLAPLHQGQSEIDTADPEADVEIPVSKEQNTKVKPNEEDNDEDNIF